MHSSATIHTSYSINIYLEYNLIYLKVKTSYISQHENMKLVILFMYAIKENIIIL